MSSRSDSPPDRPLAAALADHYEEIKAFILRKVGCAEFAADVTQDVWIKMATAAPGEPVDNPRAYLYRVAGNLAVDRLRRTARARLSPDPIPETLACDAPSADDALFQRRRLALLRAAVDELPPRCREAFLLHRFAGLSHVETAERLGVSVSMVEKHVRRALAHCRNRLARADENDKKG
jgi:RNA polymerase sigma factor (sigma-70 family)